MAEIVFGAAVAHTAQMVRSKNLLTDDQKSSVYGALEFLRREIDKQAPDVLIIFGGDHYNSFFLDNMPSICIGLGYETRTWGDGGVPEYSVPMHYDLGRELIEKLLKRKFDPAVSRRMVLDHGFACPLHFLRPEMDIPVVPILMNTIAPPLIAPSRAYELGSTIRDIVRNTGAVSRVAVIGTGGLSHVLPIPDPDSTAMDGDKELRAQMLDGRTDPSRLTSLLVRRIKEVGDSGAINFNEEFDREVVEALSSGRARELADFTTEWVARNGGNGGQEVRNWIAVAAVMNDARAELVSYDAIQPWLTGIAFMRWDR